LTPDQQRRALGISAEAEDGHIIISTDRTFMLLTPQELARFDHFLHVAFHDATAGRERPRELR
jgi:hypothetical protein